MKKIILVLFIGFSGFAQNTDNFSAEDNSLIWSRIFELKEGEDISNIKNNLKLNFKDNISGTAENQHCKCKGGSTYVKSPFSYNFKIEKKENRYKVFVSNIIFKDNLSINIGSVVNGPTTHTIEEFALKNSDNTIRKNSQNSKNLNCLDAFFTSNFSIQQQKTDW